MKSILFVFFTTFSTILSAQFEYNYSVGLNYSTMSSVKSSFNFTSFVYNPRVDFKMSKEISFSITSYLSFGINDVNTNTGPIRIAWQAPLLGQFNFGKHSSKTSEENIGCFIGLGRAVGYYSSNTILNGMYCTGGVKFGKKYSSAVKFDLLCGRQDPAGKFDYVFGVGLMLNGK